MLIISAAQWHLLMMLCIYQLTVIAGSDHHRDDHPRVKCPFKGGPCKPCLPDLCPYTHLVYVGNTGMRLISRINMCSARSFTMVAPVHCALKDNNPP